MFIHPRPVKLQATRIHIFSSLAYTTPHISIGALDSVKIFQSHFLFLNLSQYKPCSKCYEKMYMFIQGRLWQDTGGPPPAPWGGPRRRGWSLTHLCLYLLPPPFPPNPPGTSSALPPSECTHTPIPWGSSQLTLPFSPHPWRREPGSARPSPL